MTLVLCRVDSFTSLERYLGILTLITKSLAHLLVRVLSIIYVSLDSFERKRAACLALEYCRMFSPINSSTGR